jgi:hypothetical protein
MEQPLQPAEIEEHQETRQFVKSAFGPVRALGVKRLVVQADAIVDMRLVALRTRSQPRPLRVADLHKPVVLLISSP